MCDQAWRRCIDSIVADFVTAAKIAKIEMNDDDVEVRVFRPGEHNKKLGFPSGKMGVYTFGTDDRALKVGRSNGSLRVNQQYSRKTGTTGGLIVEKIKKEFPHLEYETIEEMVQKEYYRIDVLIEKEKFDERFDLTFLESFMHCRLKPKYEGRQAVEEERN